MFFCVYSLGELGILVGHSPSNTRKNLIQHPTVPFLSGGSHYQLIGGLACQHPVNYCHFPVTIKQTHSDSRALSQAHMMGPSKALCLKPSKPLVRKQQLRLQSGFTRNCRNHFVPPACQVLNLPCPTLNLSMYQGLIVQSIGLSQSERNTGQSHE